MRRRQGRSEELYKQLRDAMPKRDITEVANMVKDELDKWYKEINEIANEPVMEGRMHPRKALEVVGKFIYDNDAIATTDIGNTSSTANSYLRFRHPKRDIATLTFGNTGFAYQAALGAQLACPDKPVVSIAGDGAWGMSLFEVPTACPVQSAGHCHGVQQRRLVRGKEKSGRLLQQPLCGRGHLVQVLCQNRRIHGR